MDQKKNFLIFFLLFIVCMKILYFERINHVWSQSNYSIIYDFWTRQMENNYTYWDLNYTLI